MEERPGVVERAFQVAESGAVADFAELNAQLTAEGYDSASFLVGRSIVAQITRMIARARPPAAL